MKVYSRDQSDTALKVAQGPVCFSNSVSPKLLQMEETFKPVIILVARSSKTFFFAIFMVEPLFTRETLSSDDVNTLYTRHRASRSFILTDPLIHEYKSRI